MEVLYIIIQIHIYIINLYKLYRMVKQYIGISKDCHILCNAKQKAHSGQHQILLNTELFKKLTSWKVTIAHQLIEKFTEMINQQTENLIEKIKKNQQEAIDKLQKAMFGCIILSGVELQKELIAHLNKLGGFDYEGLTCDQLYRVQKSINKNYKQSKLQSKAEDFFRDFKRKLQQLILQNMNNISDKQSIITKDSQIKLQEQKLQHQSVENYYSKSEDPSFKQDQSSYININFGQQNKKQQQQQKKQRKQKSTLIDILASMNEKDQAEKEKFFNQPSINLRKKQKIQKVQQVQAPRQKLVKDFDEEVKVVQNVKKNSEKDQSMSMSIDISQTYEADQSVDLKQDHCASYVKKNEGKYYIRVSHLLRPQYKQQKATFNLNIKVVQQLIFRLYKDKNSSKVHSKVKFVGGDQTGIVVVYANYIPQIKKGEYISLYDCSLTHFYDKSYEIVCHKLKKNVDHDNFNVNMDLSISRMDSIKPLTYSVQKNDSSWPSIRGIVHLIKENKKKIQAIAKLQEIIEQSDRIYRVYISDGTAKVSAIISKQDCPILKQGTVYFFKRLEAFSQNYGLKQKLIYLKSTENNDKKQKKNNPPVEMNNFKYDDMEVQNINQIIQTHYTQQDQ